MTDLFPKLDFDTWEKVSEALLKDTMKSSIDEDVARDAKTQQATVAPEMQQVTPAAVKGTFVPMPLTFPLEIAIITLVIEIALRKIVSPSLDPIDILDSYIPSTEQPSIHASPQ